MPKGRRIASTPSSPSPDLKFHLLLRWLAALLRAYLLAAVQFGSKLTASDPRSKRFFTGDCWSRCLGRSWCRCRSADLRASSAAAAGSLFRNEPHSDVEREIGPDPAHYYGELVAQADKEQNVHAPHSHHATARLSVNRPVKNATALLRPMGLKLLWACHSESCGSAAAPAVPRRRRPPRLAAGANPGAGWPFQASANAVSPIAKTSGKPGAVQVLRASTRSAHRVPSPTTQPRANTPAAHKAVRAAMRSPLTTTRHPALMPLRAYRTRTSTPRPK